MSDDRHQAKGSGASSSGADGDEEIPLGQRLFDRPILLLVACIIIMFIFFTGWGWVELATLPQAPLP